jgi:hypothetical protein
MPLSPRRTERLRRRSNQLDKSCCNSPRACHCPCRALRARLAGAPNSLIGEPG